MIKLSEKRSGYMKVEELKKEESYSFECNMSEEYRNYIDYDEWGCAFAWFDDKGIGVEYNFCIQGDRTNSCAIYKTRYNPKTDYIETDYDEFEHYEIDFDNPNWIEELENAMCKALIELHGVQ